MKIRESVWILSTLTSLVLLSGCAGSEQRLYQSGNQEMTPGGCVVQGDVRSRFRNRSEFRNHCTAHGSVSAMSKSTNVQLQRGGS